MDDPTYAHGFDAEWLVHAGIFDMVIDQRAAVSDVADMTAMNVFELATLRPLPRCERCASAAWATTPGGVRCQKHSLEELEEAIVRKEADWMPRRFRRRRI